MKFDDRFIAKLEAHRKAAILLKEAKEEEMELRLDICGDLLVNAEVSVNNFKQDGLKIKATRKLKMDIDKDLLKDIYDDMDEAERGCFKFDPTLMKKNYNNLDGDSKLVNSVITVSEATPSLVVELES